MDAVLSVFLETLRRSRISVWCLKPQKGSGLFIKHFLPQNIFQEGTDRQCFLELDLVKGDNVRSDFFLYGPINDIRLFFTSLCRWHEDEQIKIAIHIDIPARKGTEKNNLLSPHIFQALHNRMKRSLQFCPSFLFFCKISLSLDMRAFPPSFAFPV